VVIILSVVSHVISMALDTVLDVITLTADQIKPDSALDTKYLVGLRTLDKHMLILVDIDRMMSSAAMGLLEKVAA
jgi:purine-binding chemotaxis protein CheW